WWTSRTPSWIRGSGSDDVPVRTHKGGSMSDQSIRAPQTVTRRARPRGADEAAYLEVTDLQVQFPTADGMVKAVQGLSYSLPLGRTLAIVGESRAGETVSNTAPVRLS